MATDLKISDKNYKGLKFSEREKELFEKVVNYQNSRVDTYNSKEFKAMFKKACSSGFTSGIRKIQNLISDSQDLVKELKLVSRKANDGIDDKIEEFKKKLDNLDSAVYPFESEKRTNYTKEINNCIEQLSRLQKQHGENIENFKAQKRDMKEIALDYGIASEKTLKNALKYMEDDLKNTKNQIISYITQKQAEQSHTAKSSGINPTVKKIKAAGAIKVMPSEFLSAGVSKSNEQMLEDLKSKIEDSKNKKGWIFNYEKIESCSKKSIDEKKFGPAIKQSIAMGEQIQKNIKLISTDEEIDPNYLEKQKSEMDGIKKQIESSCDCIIKIYKLEIGENKEKSRTLIHMAIATTVLNGVIAAAIKNTKIVSKKIGSLRVNEIDKYLKELSFKNTNDKKTGDKKLYSYKFTRFKNFCKIFLKSLAVSLFALSILVDIVGMLLLPEVFVPILSLATWAGMSVSAITLLLHF